MLWCNGSTLDSGSGSLGSNPSSNTFNKYTMKRILASYYCDVKHPTESFILKRFEIVEDIETKEKTVMCLHINKGKAESVELPLVNFEALWNILLTTLLYSI